MLRLTFACGGRFKKRPSDPMAYIRPLQTPLYVDPVARGDGGGGGDGVETCRI